MRASTLALQTQQEYRDKPEAKPRNPRLFDQR